MPPRTTEPTDHSAAEPGQLLGAIFSGSPDAVIVINEAGTIVLSSPATTALFGYYPEELVGASLSILLPKAVRERHEHHLATFFAAPHARQMGAGLELAGLHRDGSEFAVDVSLAPAEIGGTRYAAAFVRDARERQRAVERLNAVNQVGQQLLAGTPPDQILPSIVYTARTLNRSDAAWIVLPDSGGDLEIAAADGPGTEILLGITLSAETSRSAIALRTGRAEILEDLSTADNVPAPVSMLDLGPGLYMPLVGKDRHIGVLVFGRVHGAEPFDRVSVAFAEVFASAVATAIELSEIRDELERLGIVAEDERIARDLHDTVIQQLFAIGMSLQATTGLLEGPARNRIEASMDALDGVIKEIRNTIFRLPGRHTGEESGLREALLRIAEVQREQLGFTPRIAFDGPVELAVTPGIAEHLVHVFGEGLSNVARHARAQSVEAVLRVRDGWLTLVLSDDGLGIADRPSAGNGLRNLAGRAAALGGSLELRPREPHGTVLEWQVPL